MVPTASITRAVSAGEPLGLPPISYELSQIRTTLQEFWVDPGLEVQTPLHLSTSAVTESVGLILGILRQDSPIEQTTNSWQLISDEGPEVFQVNFDVLVH